MPTLTDGRGFRWDFTSRGLSVNDGTSDAYDVAFVLQNYLPSTDPTESGRYIIGASQTVNDLTVIRRAYVSATDGWARFEEVLTNNTASTLTRTFTIDSNFGSDGSTQIIATGSGDTAVSTADTWLITDDGTDATVGDPRLGFVFRGVGAGPVLSGLNVSGDNLSVTYTVTLAPGQTAVLLHFGAQSRDAAGLQSLMTSISADVAPFLTDMPANLVERLVNFNSGRVVPGTDAAETLVGGAGNDTINGLGGNDSLVGLGGSDSLNGGTGDDTMAGGAGSDTYIVDSVSDVITEFSGAANGTADTVRSSVTRTLEAAVENLVLTGTSAISGTGNALANRITGNSANNTLNGAGGNDTLDGLSGEDLLIGGTGDDVFYINSAGDRISEIAGQGTDKVFTTISYTLGTAIENATALGASNVTLIGNSLNNRLEGNAGDNFIRGGGGADTLLGGSGNDTLVAEGGNDVLIGGVGRDTFVFTGAGGTYTIEDEIGVEVISARGASVGATINLNPGSVTTIGGDIINLSNGTSISADLDFVFLQDLSGSFGDDVATVRTLVPNITNALTTIAPNVRYGYASFVDKPLSPFGSSTDYVYRTDLALTADTAAVQATVNGLTILSGSDFPESQIEALMQVALRQAEVGYRPGSLRVVLLMTDAEYHQAGDLTGVPANDGDTILDGTPPGSGEDFPSVALVRQAVLEAGILPIFAVTTGQQTTYQNLVSQLGVGAVVNLASDSANIITAIRNGLEAVATTRIEGAEGSNQADSITGNALDNTLLGLSGADTISGGDGNDTISGGFGADSMTGGDGLDVLSYEGTVSDMNVTLGLVWTILGSGERGGDVFSGFEGIRTGAGDDVLNGSIQADRLEGWIGADSLIGGGGNDTLVGGAGKDLHVGGGGLDRMVFNTLADSGVTFAARDVISTFAHGDKIDLTAIDANTVLAGDQAFSWRASGAFTGAAGQLRFDMTNISATGVKAYTVYGDVNGDRIADFSLQIFTAPTADRPGLAQTWNLEAWDFIL
jgi:Ca2+-binding RTX toxin-like protein